MFFNGIMALLTQAFTTFLLCIFTNKLGKFLTWLRLHYAFWHGKHSSKHSVLSFYVLHFPIDIAVVKGNVYGALVSGTDMSADTSPAVL
jgi:hypothetical protein